MLLGATEGVPELVFCLDEVEDVRLRFLDSSTRWPGEEGAELVCGDEVSAISGSTQSPGDSDNVPSQSRSGSSQMGDEA